MAIPRQIRWNPPGLLQVKYSTHPAGYDRECWIDLVEGRPATSVADKIRWQDYELASYQVWDTYVMQVQCTNRRRSSSGMQSDEVRVSRVDERGIRVIAAAHDGSVRTCYHLHDPRERHRSPTAILPEQLREMFCQRLRDDAARELETGHQPSIEEIEWRR